MPEIRRRKIKYDPLRPPRAGLKKGWLAHDLREATRRTGGPRARQDPKLCVCVCVCVCVRALGVGSVCGGGVCFDGFWGWVTSLDGSFSTCFLSYCGLIMFVVAVFGGSDVGWCCAWMEVICC